MLRKLTIIIVTFALGIPLLIVGVMVIRPYTGAGRQERGMALADQHIQAQAALLAQMHANPRFSEVTAQVGTGGDGCIVLGGIVAADDDARQIQQLWESTHPPVKTLYLITTYPEPTFSDLKRQHELSAQPRSPRQ